MTNNNWIEGLEETIYRVIPSIDPELHYHEIVDGKTLVQQQREKIMLVEQHNNRIDWLKNELTQFISNLLTKKDQEHKAELEMIREEVQKLLETLPELESDEYDAGLLDMKHLVLAILDSHINKLSTE